MYLATGYENKKARIEIVPLIDVVFLLLVFFIYAMLSMSVYRGLRIDLPKGDGMVEDRAILLIGIDSSNNIMLDGKQVGMDEVVREAEMHADRDHGAILVSGDRNSDLGVSVELLSRIRACGVKTVSFEVSTDE
ncbi:MAG: biopolymer transporter ExbD [Lentisphaerae bacterium]|nr:biopolymer transporter ExbD [Lentisphaerota bacterium]